MKNVIKESPVTIFLLALTTLVFIAMQVIYFGNATSNQAILILVGCSVPTYVYFQVNCGA